jgi:predicted PurR-regulated permease PerM
MTIQPERSTPPSSDDAREPEPDEAQPPTGPRAESHTESRAEPHTESRAEPHTESRAERHTEPDGESDGESDGDGTSERFGRPGRPLDRRSPFFVGMTGAAGVAVTYGVVQLIIAARSVLILIGLALFIAAGLDPLVSWLTRRRLPRWAAVTIVLVGALAALGGFLAAAIPPLAEQTTALADQVPHYLHSLQDHNSQVGKLNDKFHLQQRLTGFLSGGGTSLVGGVLGAGKMVLSAATSLLVVLVLAIYFLAGMPSIKNLLYRLAPRSRRSRAILITEDIFTKVGGFVLGNIATSLIAGAGTYVWLLIFGIPYPILLAVFVALVDLIPVVGSTVGGVIVALIALTVSLPVAIATAVFYIAYRQAEDYFLVPKIMGRAVEVPAVVTVLATLIGGALLGIVGALIAIPVAAAIRLLLNEIALPRLDHS